MFMNFVPVPRQLPGGGFCARIAAILVCPDHLRQCIMHCFLMITYYQLQIAVIICTEFAGFPGSYVLNI